MNAWIDLLVRLSRAPVVSIASIRGRARRWKRIRAGLRPAIRLTREHNDFDGPRAELYGYVNRAIVDDQLDDEVEAVASRLAGFDHDAIARTKPYADQVTLPADNELPPALADFFELLGRPAQQARSARLEALDST